MRSVTYFIYLIFFGLLFLNFSCGGDSGNGGDTEPDPDPIPVPFAASLIFPDNNSECTEGTVLNENQSRVLFQWNASQNTDSYQVNLRNLNTNSTALTNSNTNEVEITLLRGVPYEWFVISKANGTIETAQSETWAFYNSGPGITNYAPFPAQAVAPSRGATINAAPTVTLEWTGNDVDDDIVSYSIYFGSQETPPLVQEGITSNTFEISISSGTTYFWQIETLDEAGNHTLSETFVFQVQ